MDCPVCGYVYEEDWSDPVNPIKKGKEGFILLNITGIDAKTGWRIDLYMCPMCKSIQGN